jgi:predicted HAD superfamily Cof-like phosphohydrolase
MTTNYSRVKKFNEVFGHPAPIEVQRNILSKRLKLVELRNALIDEEIHELLDAYRSNDVIEIIDALSDILYVAYGLMVVYGLNGDTLFSEFIASHYTNLGQRLPNSFDSLTNYLKVKTYMNQFNELDNNLKCIPKTFLDMLDNIKYKVIYESLLSDLKLNMRLLRDYSVAKDFKRVTGTTLNIIYITYNIGYIMDLDLDESVRLVHDSNMSKICSTEEQAKLTIEWYKTNETRYDSPNYRDAFDKSGYVIYNESTGKILKNKDYFQVDLRKFLE